MQTVDLKAIDYDGKMLQLSGETTDISIRDEALARSRKAFPQVLREFEIATMIDSADRTPNPDNAPLSSLDEWEDDLLRRYPRPTGQAAAEKKPAAFRDHEGSVRPSVREFYRLNHTHQSVDFVRQKRAEYLPLKKRRMSVWEAMEYLNRLTDDSDPDTELPQIEHSLQTLLAIREAGHPRWFQLVGLIHDLGKVLCLFDEPQWAVVGDTFPVGCRYSEKIVFPEFFAANPDSQVPEYQSEVGIYEKGCGLDNVMMSWGHDEYLYHVVKDYIPEEGLYMIRYHSFYPAHREGAYGYLMNDHDRELFRWVKKFSPFDLYSKSTERPDLATFKPYCEELIDEFLPPVLNW